MLIWRRVNAALVHDLQILHAALATLCENTSLPSLPSLRYPISQTHAWSPTVPQGQDLYESPSRRVGDLPGNDNADVEAELLVAPSHRSTVTESPNRLPIESLYEITHLRSLRSRQLESTPVSMAEPSYGQTDLISKGVIQWSHAERLVMAYLARSDHYLYGIASKYKDLDSIRRSSSLLLAAICTVAALQDRTAADTYRACHAELLALISRFIFKPTVELEDLRGLCIACFWLSDISWSVSGLAIRRAYEVDLQKSFYAIVLKAGLAPNASSTRAPLKPVSDLAVECMRLWYLFYICDQHLSILYGRTPTLRNQGPIQNCEAYLPAVPASSDDVRIISQVSLLRILSAVADTFGSNIECRVPIVFKPQLENFVRQLDGWVTDWLSHCGKNT